MMRVSVLRLAAALALFAAVCGSRAEVIDDILSSLSRGVSFLERQHEHINLDGVVGFVILQGRTVYQLQENIWRITAVYGLLVLVKLTDMRCRCRSNRLYKYAKAFKVKCF